MEATRTTIISSPVAFTRDRAAEKALAICGDLLRDFHPRDFAIRLWDGSCLHADLGQSPRCTLVINHPGAMRRIFLPDNQAALGEAYAYGDVDIEGDAEALFPLAPFLVNSRFNWRRKLRLGALLLGMPKSDSRRRGRTAAKLDDTSIRESVIGRR